MEILFCKEERAQGIFVSPCMNLFNWFEPTFGGVPRSGKWPTVRKTYLTAYPMCLVCRTRGSLLKTNEVHHIKPYHLHPELELDPTNFITFCRPHHLLVGHLMDWSSVNENVVEDAVSWAMKIAHRPNIAVDNEVDTDN